MVPAWQLSGFLQVAAVVLFLERETADCFVEEVV